MNARAFVTVPQLQQNEAFGIILTLLSRIRQICQRTEKSEGKNGKSRSRNDCTFSWLNSGQIDLFKNKYLRQHLVPFNQLQLQLSSHLPNYSKRPFNNTLSYCRTTKEKVKKKVAEKSSSFSRVVASPDRIKSVTIPRENKISPFHPNIDSQLLLVSPITKQDLRSGTRSREREKMQESKNKRSKRTEGLFFGSSQLVRFVSLSLPYPSQLY